MTTIKELTKKIVTFRDERNWKQFHNPKDQALSLVLEASELLEHFQWKNRKQAHAHIETESEAIGDELADVLYWVFLIAHDFKIDLNQALQDKLKKNERKYPIKKSFGKKDKYSEL